MRTHAQIITDAGGPAILDAATQSKPGTAKQWRRIDSIPAAHWSALADNGITTLEELAAAAAARVKPIKDKAMAPDGRLSEVAA